MYIKLDHGIDRLLSILMKPDFRMYCPHTSESLLPSQWNCLPQSCFISFTSRDDGLIHLMAISLTLLLPPNQFRPLQLFMPLGPSLTYTSQTFLFWRKSFLFIPPPPPKCSYLQPCLWGRPDHRGLPAFLSVGFFVFGVNYRGSSRQMFERTVSSSMDLTIHQD